jgi:phosphate starvation-inducible PhoH-like protein
VHTKVLTPSGFRPIGDLAVGDLVVGSNGEPTPVLGVYPQGPKRIYRLVSRDGAATLCSEDHLWAVKTPEDRRRGASWRVVETKEMVGRFRAARARKYELPLLTSPVALPERAVPIEPYALGLLLGDGRLTGSATPTLVAMGAERTSLTAADPATDALRRPGPVGPHASFVPELYLNNSADVRLGVLQGLLDSAGEPVAVRDRTGSTGSIRYATRSQRLRDDVTGIVRSLGGVVTSRRRQDAFVLDIRLPAGVEPFRLSTKVEEYRACGCGRPARFVDRIEPAGTEEAVCIQVAAADSLYVTEDYLLTHNTLNDAFIILDEAQNTSPEQMKMFLTRLGFGSKIVVTGDITQVDLPGGQQSGLRVVQGILQGVDDVHFSNLTSHDVVRHKLVGDIVDAYDRWQATHDSEPEVRHSGPRRGR